MKESNKKGSWGRKLFWILFFLVFGITAVTNLAIDHQFTWFRIVGSSLILRGCYWMLCFLVRMRG